MQEARSDDGHTVAARVEPAGQAVGTDQSRVAGRHGILMYEPDVHVSLDGLANGGAARDSVRSDISVGGRAGAAVDDHPLSGAGWRQQGQSGAAKVVGIGCSASATADRP